MMADTPDVRPVGDLPDAIGKTAARELSSHGIRSLRQVADHSPAQLLAIHGVGPKAIRILGEALAERGLAYRDA
jgi:predicted flap endonuclease-1-like 5' DNA nuclease